MTRRQHDWSWLLQSIQCRDNRSEPGSFVTELLLSAETEV
jgi:hypothetical protein